MTLPTDMKKLHTMLVSRCRAENMQDVLPKGCARCAHKLAQCSHDSIWPRAIAEDADSACR